MSIDSPYIRKATVIFTNPAALPQLNLQLNGLGIKKNLFERLK